MFVSLFQPVLSHLLHLVRRSDDAVGDVQDGNPLKRVSSLCKGLFPARDVDLTRIPVGNKRELAVGEKQTDGEWLDRKSVV